MSRGPVAYISLWLAEARRRSFLNQSELGNAKLPKRTSSEMVRKNGFKDKWRANIGIFNFVRSNV